VAAYEAWMLPLDDTLKNEYRYAIATIESGETRAGGGEVCVGSWQAWVVLGIKLK
jgi:hypothetical protein